MSAGARGVVSAEPRPEELAASLLDAVGATAPAQERRRDGRVVAVCAAKGGVGATTVAVGTPRRPRACSSTPPPGTAPLAGHLGCHPQRSLADLARLAGSGRRRRRRGRAHRAPEWHRRGGGALRARDLVGLLPSGLGAALARECRSVAGTTVFDLGRPGSPFAIETARCADAVVLVLTPDALAATAAAATIGDARPPRRRPGRRSCWSSTAGAAMTSAAAGDRGDARRAGARSCPRGRRRRRPLQQLGRGAAGQAPRPGPGPRQPG